MKRFLLILLALLLLAGCAKDDVLPTEPTNPPTEATEPPISWVEEAGMPWDADGILKEMPLTIPDGLHYAAVLEFDGDLLLWSQDNHLANQSTIEMCLVELDDGSIIAQRDVTVSMYLIPRAVGDYLYLCDAEGGVIYQLDKHLETVQEWTFTPEEGDIYMGHDGTAYLYNYEEMLCRFDLETGEKTPVLEGDPEICWLTESEDSLVIKYYTVETGAPAYAVLDLVTGTCSYANSDRHIDSASRIGNAWLYEKYLEDYIYYLHIDGEEQLRFVPEESTITILPEGYLMRSTMDGTTLALYNMDGTSVSACTILENGNGYLTANPIWNEEQGGYFFILRNYDDVGRLIFWDISKTIENEDLVMEPLPETDAEQAALEARAAELEQKYGVTILVGDQCDTQFDEFSATLVSDWDRVITALDTLDQALSVYPNGFFRQLRFGYVQGIQIHLISDLQAHGSGRTGGGYNAFTQEQYDHYLMVMDIDESMVQTYYHEFSHIIDTYLQWCADNKEGVLYDNEYWCSLNPSWFTGYTYDYSQRLTLRDMTSFIDSYATISPTEDRARVMEYAMIDNCEWTYRNSPVLQKKLDYYSRCIRDAFDTTGWKPVELWEQYLEK